MANLVKSIYTGADVTSLGEVTSSDSVSIPCAVGVTGTINASRGIGATWSGFSGSSQTFDFANYQNFIVTLNYNFTMGNPSTESVGQSGFFVFKQDATGGYTVSLGSEFKTAGGAGLTLSSAANAIDIVPYIVSASGQILLGAPQLAFA